MLPFHENIQLLEYQKKRRKNRENRLRSPPFVSHMKFIPVKSSSALSSTSSSGLSCFCSNKLLAALRDVKISFSCNAKLSNQDKEVQASESNYVIFNVCLGFTLCKCGQNQTFPPLTKMILNFFNFAIRSFKGCA